MTTYEEASCRWAARRLGIDRALIESVDISIGTDGYESTGFYGVVEAHVVRVDGTRGYIDLRDDGLHLPTILEQLFAEVDTEDTGATDESS